MLKIELELENDTLRRTVRSRFLSTYKIPCFSYSRHQNVFDTKPFYKKPLDGMIRRFMVIILILFVCCAVCFPSDCGMLHHHMLHSHTTLTKCSNYKPVFGTSV